MAEISKTAKASMVQNTEAKKDRFDTNEKKIAELRRQRDPGFPLAVNRYDFIDALLEEYDKLQKTLADKQTILDSFVNGVAAAQAEQKRVRVLLESVKSLYYSAVWHADRPVDEKALWEAVRDAAGFEPGNAPVEIPQPASAELRQEHDVIMREITS